MTKLLPVIVILVLAIGGGYYFFTQQNQTKNTDTKTEAVKTVNKSPKIGIVSKKSSVGYEEVVKGLKAEMEKRGYTPTYLQDEIVNDDYVAIADKYVDQKVDVIVVNSTNATKAVQKATTTIPVIFGSVGDPVLNGIMANMDTPDGNVTGVSSFAVDLAPERFALIKTLKPSVKKIYVVHNTNDSSGENALNKIRKQAEKMGVTIVEKTGKDAAEVKAILKELKASEADGIMTTTTSIMTSLVADIVAAQNATKLPTVGQDGTWADKGAVAAYGAHYLTSGKQVANMIDLILNGKSIKEIPAQRPEKVEMVINKKAAATIGLEIPADVLKRADRIIE